MSYIECVRRLPIRTLIKKSCILKQFTPVVLNKKILHNSLNDGVRNLHLTKLNLNKNDDNVLNDAEMQELMKSMYEDFEIKDKSVDRNSVNEIISPKGEQETCKDSSTLDVDNSFDSSYETLHYNEDIIYDYDEEQILREKGLWEERKRKKVKSEIIYERGKFGVFDLEELVEFLRDQKAMNIVAIYVPPELQYVNYLVIATLKSRKHGTALMEFLMKVYKKKKNSTDKSIKYEGKGTQWLAVDMGNIALHVMGEEIRLEKNLESLWTVGAEFDEQSLEWENPYSVKELLQYHREMKENE